MLSVPAGRADDSCAGEISACDFGLSGLDRDEIEEFEAEFGDELQALC